MMGNACIIHRMMGNHSVKVLPSRSNCGMMMIDIILVLEIGRGSITAIVSF